MRWDCWNRIDQRQHPRGPVYRHCDGGRWDFAGCITHSALCGVSDERGVGQHDYCGITTHGRGQGMDSRMACVVRLSICVLCVKDSFETRAAQLSSARTQSH